MISEYKRMKSLNNEYLKVNSAIFGSVIPGVVDLQQIIVKRQRAILAFYNMNPDLAVKHQSIIDDACGSYCEAKLLIAQMMEVSVAFNSSESYLNDLQNRSGQQLDDDTVLVSLYRKLGRAVPYRVFSYNRLIKKKEYIEYA